MAVLKNKRRANQKWANLTTSLKESHKELNSRDKDEVSLFSFFGPVTQLVRVPDS